MRKHTFEVSEYYHIYNRGNDKRNIFLDEYDLHRFIQSVVELNVPEPIGSIYENSFKNRRRRLGSETTKLVSLSAYCLNPNHFHFLMTPLMEKGVEKFMQKLGGYTRYFNEKHKKSGTLFQGVFKSKHIQNNRYLLHLSAYINMNNRDELGSETTKLSRSSLEEWVEKEYKGVRICDPSIVMDQFPSREKYRKFALESWADIQNRKKELKLDELDFLPW